MGAFFGGDRRPDFDVGDYLTKSREHVQLVISKSMAEQIRAASQSRFALDSEETNIPVCCIDRTSLADIQAQLEQLAPSLAGRTVIVCHEVFEDEITEFLSERIPSTPVFGFMEDFVPAVMAQTAGRLVRNARDGKALPPLPKQLVCVVATPRSGSSFLCDVLTDMGLGRPKEHLRDSTIAFLSAPYAFSRVKFFENFLRLSNVYGWASTKLITHFLYDFSQQIDPEPFFEVLRKHRVRVRPIFLDRRDRVAQTSSGDLASRRRIWHVRDTSDEQALLEAPEIRYVFRSMLGRYLNYQSQGAFLTALRSVAADRLDLYYEEDIGDVDKLVAKISAFLGTDPARFRPDISARRRKISDLIRSDNGERFAADFEALFGTAP
jgi:LPS sulfotransferase NodH